MKNGFHEYPFHRHGRPRKGERSFLATHGISKRLSMQAQALASLPKEIQEAVADRRMSLTAAVQLFHLARRLVMAGITPDDLLTVLNERNDDQ